MINKVILVGRLGADPEIKQTKKGDAFANMSIATNKKMKDEEKTTWHKVVVFDPRLADMVGKYVKAGTQLYLEGEIETRTYEDSGGQKRYVTEIIVPRFSGVIRMLSPKGENKPAAPVAPAASSNDDAWDRQF
tara:strand:- start:8 stop:406 length:399 start_codon:yes stop_codon:yes gene_type:complete